MPGESGLPVRCRGSEEAEVTEGGKCRETEAGAKSQEWEDAFCSWEYRVNQPSLRRFLKFDY